MGQAKSVKKTKEEKKIKSRNSLKVVDSPPVVQDQDSLEPESLWKEEVDALLGQKFSSLVEVIDAIADRVCERLGEPADSELHDFLVMMFDTDEEIRQELEDIFELKK